jgi:lipid-binding SYLF domain-containing protein
MFRQRRLTLGIMFVLALALVRPSPAMALAARDDGADKDIQRVQDSIRVLGEMMKEADKSIPKNLLAKSAGIAIIPGVIKAAYVIGGRHGNGVLVVRGKDGGWSSPSFIKLTGGSLGLQIGVESADILLLFMTPRSVENITKGKFTLGADAGLAAGPLGRAAEASTDAELKAEIYSYSRSRGLFAGLSLQGASLSVDGKANERFYQLKGVGAQTIFEGKVLKIPDIVAKLRKALEEAAGK